MYILLSGLDWKVCRIFQLRVTHELKELEEEEDETSDAITIDEIDAKTGAIKGKEELTTPEVTDEEPIEDSEEDDFEDEENFDEEPTNEDLEELEEDLEGDEL